MLAALGASERFLHSSMLDDRKLTKEARDATYQLSFCAA